MENRYFIVNTNDPRLSDILNVCLESELTPLSLDGSVGVCKLPLFCNELPSCLEGVTEFTQEEIKVVIRGVDFFDENLY